MMYTQKTSNFPQCSLRLPQRRDRIVRVYNRVYTDIYFFCLFIYFYLIWKQQKKPRHQNFVVGQTNQSAKTMSHYKTKLNKKLIHFIIFYGNNCEEDIHSNLLGGYFLFYF